jgi:hypothetical protein
LDRRRRRPEFDGTAELDVFGDSGHGRNLDLRMAASLEAQGCPNIRDRPEPDPPPRNEVVQQPLFKPARARLGLRFRPEAAN